MDGVGSLGKVTQEAPLPSPLPKGLWASWSAGCEGVCACLASGRAQGLLPLPPACLPS